VAAILSLLADRSVPDLESRNSHGDASCYEEETKKIFVVEVKEENISILQSSQPEKSISLH
jgi:hypothetical protein